MVALLVGLRLRQLGRTLTRSPWAIVTLAITALGALGALGLVGSLFAVLRVAAPDAGPDAAVVAGAALVVGWAIAAVLVSADDALAPERFAPLPLRAGQLLPGVLLGATVGVGGIATTLALLTTLIGWSVDGWALAIAALLLPLQLLTCLLAGRAVAAALARQFAKRGARDLVIVLGSVLAISAGLLVPAVVEGVRALGAAESLLGAVADVLGWTPIGAAWDVPHAVLGGQPLVALARLAIALSTVALLGLVWALDFRARLTAPVVRGGGGPVRSGAWLDRLLPSTPVGAIAARGLRYRFRDPRHLVNVIGVLVLPLLLLGVNFVVGRSVELELGAEPAPLGVLAAAGPMLLPVLGAVVLMSIAQLDAAYDGSALAAHVLAGVSGTADRAGRALGMAVLFAPMLVGACLVSTAVSGRWDLLPASLGATLGTGGIVIGVGSAISAWLPGQAPAPEASPFGTGSSGGGQSLIGAMLMMASTVTVGLPAIGTAIAALWIPWLGWVSLAAGLGVGAGVTLLGVRIGGRGLDRRWPELLAAVSREP